MSKRWSILKPLCNAFKLAASMTGPSATGSEKGIPSSKESTPASFNDNAKSTVKLLLGNPAVMYATNFFILFFFI